MSSHTLTVYLQSYQARQINPNQEPKGYVSPFIMCIAAPREQLDGLYESGAYREKFPVKHFLVLRIAFQRAVKMLGGVFFLIF